MVFVLVKCSEIKEYIVFSYYDNLVRYFGPSVLPPNVRKENYTKQRTGTKEDRQALKET